MMDNLQAKISGVLSKIKKVKHFQVYLALGLAVIMALIYFSLWAPKKKVNGNTSQDTVIDNTLENISSSSEYTSYIENKLENVITSIKGVSDAKVVVTLEKGFEYVYATEEEIKTSSNGTTITSVSIVMVDGQPVIKEEIYPIVKGIVVVADGAEDVGVRMNILSIIQTIIKVDNSQINIFAGQ